VTARPDDLMFRAFADERRLRILHLLRRRETCVADLVEILGLPQSTVSRQLGILRERGWCRIGRGTLAPLRDDGTGGRPARAPRRVPGELLRPRPRAPRGRDARRGTARRGRVLPRGGSRARRGDPRVRVRGTGRISLRREPASPEVERRRSPAPMRTGTSHQRPDHRGERRPRVDAKDSDCHRYRELEVVARGRERERRRLRVVCSDLPA